MGLGACKAFCGIIEIYPVHASESISLAYQVKVDGKDVPVIQNSRTYAHFSFSGPISVVVTLPSSADAFTISPKRLAPIVQRNGATITFGLNRPGKFVIHKGYAADALVLFADSLDASMPDPKSPAVAVAAARGVDATGGIDNKARIQALIDSLSQLGAPRTLYFGPGIYKTGGLKIKNNVTVYLAGGALLSFVSTVNIPGSDNPGSGGNGPQACIAFDHVAKASLLGRGTIESNGLGHAIKGFFADQIHVAGVIARNAGAYNTHFVSSTNIVISNIKVLNNK